MYTYRNTTSQDVEIPNVGVVAASKTIDRPREIHNALLEEVKEEKPKKDK